jgi:hypothetical protein
MTSRRSNPPRSPVSTTAPWTTGTGLRDRRGRGAFECVATHGAPPHRVGARYQCTGSDASFALQMQISRHSSPRLAAPERRPLQSHKGLICHMFSGYREYSRDEEERGSRLSWGSGRGS